MWRMKGSRIGQPFDAFEENGQCRCASSLLRVERMFEGN